MISDLLQNKIDLSLLVITKALGKKLDEEDENKKSKKGGEEKGKYANKQVHVELAKRLQKRDIASAPRVGDRVAYVIVQGAKGAKAYEKSEDPIYVLNNNLALDYEHYIEHHLKNPLVRLFTPILKDAEKEIFVGDHMRNVYR
jgi:DNA polymerase delta subunit 1